MKIAMISEVCEAGADRCANYLMQCLKNRYEIRYYPRDKSKRETVEGLLSDLRVFKPDVVHLHSFESDLPYSFLDKVSHLYPTLFTAHDVRPVGTMLPKCWECAQYKSCLRCPLVESKWARYSLLFNKYFRERTMKKFTHLRAKRNLKIIAPCKWMQNKLAQSELSRFEIVHIPYGVDTEQFNYSDEARRKVGWKNGEKMILYSAFTKTNVTRHYRKGLKYLVQAFEQVIYPKYPNAHLKIISKEKIPVHSNIESLGYLEYADLPLYYAAADIFAAPSLADNLPFTILEAMASGKPVVGFKTGGIPEEVLHEKNGFLVERKNFLELGKFINELLRDDSKAMEFGKLGRALVEKEFSLELFAQRHEELYRRTLEEAKVNVN